MGKKAKIKNINVDKSESTIAKAHKELMFRGLDLQKMTDLEENLRNLSKEERL